MPRGRAARRSFVGAVRDDVVALQERVGSQMVQTAVIVEGCAAKLDAPTKAAWDDMAKRAFAFSSQNVPLTGSYDAQMAQGALLLTELNGWGPKLAALGCSGTPPPAPVPVIPEPASPSNVLSNLFGSLGDVKPIIELVAIVLLLREFGKK